MVHQLLDVVRHAVALPLRIDMQVFAQSEAIEPFVVPEVAVPFGAPQNAGMNRLFLQLR